MLASERASTKDRSSDSRRPRRAPRAAPAPGRRQGLVDESVRDRDPERRPCASDGCRVGRRGRETPARRLRRKDGCRTRARDQARDGTQGLIVLDASAAVEMLAESETGVVAAAAIAEERLVVPAHFDVEVYATFRRLFRHSKLDRKRFDAIVVRLAALAAERVGLSALLLEAHVIADRVSATDAFYVALARARNLELLTTDAHLAQCGGTLAHIRLIRPG